jgi:hypothetical protein
MSLYTGIKQGRTEKKVIIAMFIVIGFVGRIGSGKTTAARCIQRYCNQSYDNSHHVHAVAFSDPLKAAVCELFFLDGEQVHCSELKEKPIPELNGHSPRTLMQTFGTAIMREGWPKILKEKGIPNVVSPDEKKYIGGSFWVWHMFQRIQRLEKAYCEGQRKREGLGVVVSPIEDPSHHHTVVLVHDVRFPDEMEMLQKEYGAKMVHLQRGDPPSNENSADLHPSEGFAQFLRHDCDLKVVHSNFEDDLFRKPLEDFLDGIIMCGNGKKDDE